MPHVFIKACVKRIIIPGALMMKHAATSWASPKALDFAGNWEMSPSDGQVSCELILVPAEDNDVSLMVSERKCHGDLVFPDFDRVAVGNGVLGLISSINGHVGAFLVSGDHYVMTTRDGRRMTMRRV
jgi:hypothetical protein